MTTKNTELLSAWGAFFEAHALAVRQVAENLKGRAPLSLDEYDVLLTVSRAEGGRIRYSALASATVFTKSGITRIVGRLEERGYLQRQSCDEDRRGAFATLTAKGKDAMRRTWELYSREVLVILESCFSAEEASLLRELLERIVGQVRNRPLVSIGRKKSH